MNSGKDTLGAAGGRLLILDLDETLIHASEVPQQGGFPVGPFSVVSRPGVREFLDWCQEYFQLAIWTTATEDYTRLVLREIAGPEFPFMFVWCRERCTLRRIGDDGRMHWRKNLKKVRRRGWDLAHVLMLEDTPENLASYYGNVIRISPFTGDMQDRELWRLKPLLLELRQYPDVRRVEKRGWQNRFPVPAQVAPAEPA